MNLTILNYLVLMLYNLRQNPWSAILTTLLTAFPQSWFPKPLFASSGQRLERESGLSPLRV
jgi:hypothetical protein